MKISKKCQYALRAIFQLAWRNEAGPTKTRDIARAQQMSIRFTEVILNELKHGGFVESRRGNDGGYILARNAEDLNVREIIEYIQGPISLAPDELKTDESAFGNDAFKEFWQQANEAVWDVCEKKTFADLVEFEQSKRQNYVANYNI